MKWKEPENILFSGFFLSFFTCFIPVKGTPFHHFIRISLLIYIADKGALKGFIISAANRNAHAAPQRKLCPADFFHIGHVYQITVVTPAELIRRHLSFKLGQGKNTGAVPLRLMYDDIVVVAFNVSYLRQHQADRFAADPQYGSFGLVIEFPVGTQRSRQRFAADRL